MLTFSEGFPCLGKVNLTLWTFFLTKATAHGKNLHNLIGNNELRDAELIRVAQNARFSIFPTTERTFFIPVANEGSIGCW